MLILGAVASWFLDHLGVGKAAKASRRDMAALLASGEIAGTTVATTMQIAALAESYELFYDWANFLRLWQSCNDLLMRDERSSHVGKHCLAVARGPVELTVGITVAHFNTP